MKRGHFKSIGLNIRTKLMDAEKGAIKNKHGWMVGRVGVRGGGVTSGDDVDIMRVSGCRFLAAGRS